MSTPGKDGTSRLSLPGRGNANAPAPAGANAPVPAGANAPAPVVADRPNGAPPVTPDQPRAAALSKPAAAPAKAAKPAAWKDPAKGRKRTGARVAAVQALFNAEQSGESPEAVLDQFVRHRLGAAPGQEGFEDGRVEEADVPLFARIVRAAATHGDDLDQVIAQHLAAGWGLPRLDPVLRAILRAGGGELRDLSGPPARVVIKEYMDIAHGFFGGEEPRFCNGVLDAMARTLRAEEF